MPCTVDMSYEYAAQAKEYEEAFCEAMTLIEELGAIKKVSPKCKKLWKKHEEREEEKLREEALAKLTARERRILGLE